MDLESVNETVIGAAKKAGADEAISLFVMSDEVMARFANDSLTVTKKISDASLFVYLTKNKSRTVGASSNPEVSAVKRFVGELYDSLLSLPEEPDFAELPTKARTYRGASGRVRKLLSSEDEVPEDLRSRHLCSEECGCKENSGRNRVISRQDRHSHKHGNDGTR